MPPIRITPGLKVRVKRHARRLPAVIVGTMPTASLVWVKFEGEDPTVVDLHDITLSEVTAAEDDISLWETEVFDTPPPSKPQF
jgi:hypothetical protein